MTDFDVSVVIAAYESERWIGDTLESIRRQTLQPREVIVVDDGSRDATAAIAERAGAVVLQRQHGGPSSARNAGIVCAQGRWIAFCDADDLWLPHKLERHALASRYCPDAMFTFSDWYIFDEHGVRRQVAMCDDPAYRAVRRTMVAPGIARCERESLATGLYASFFVLTSALVARRSALLRAGLFATELRIAEDYDLVLRLTNLYGAAATIEERLVAYRRSPSALCADEVVNTKYHRKLWARIEAEPACYPRGAVTFLRTARLRRARISGVYALRTARFAEARAHLAEALRLQPSAMLFASFLAAVVFDNPPGRRLHERLLRRWEQRRRAIRYGDALPS